MVHPAARVRVRDDLVRRWRVTVDTSPLKAPAGITNLTSGARGATDEGGVCRLENLLPREELDVAVHSGIGLTQRETVTLSPGEVRTLTFVLGAGCSVRGTAVDERGEALSAIDLWRLPTRGQPAYLEQEHDRAVVDKARTDEHGALRFENVPAGEWWIGPAPYHRRDGLVPLATRVTITPDERVLALTIVCHDARYIRGRVLDPDGKAAAASVDASQGGGDEAMTAGSSSVHGARGVAGARAGGAGTGLPSRCAHRRDQDVILRLQPAAAAGPRP